MLTIRKWKKHSDIDVFHEISELFLKQQSMCTNIPVTSNIEELSKICAKLLLFIPFRFCSKHRLQSSVFIFICCHWSPCFYGNACLCLYLRHEWIEFWIRHVEQVERKICILNQSFKMVRQENRSEKKDISVYIWWKEGAFPVTFFINSIWNVISRWKLFRILQAELLAEPSYWIDDIDQWSYILWMYVLQYLDHKWNNTRYSFR